MSLPSESQVLQLFQGTGQQQYTMKRLIQHFTVAVEERPAFRDAIRAMVARGNWCSCMVRATPCRNV